MYHVIHIIYINWVEKNTTCSHAYPTRHIINIINTCISYTACILYHIYISYIAHILFIEIAENNLTCILYTSYDKYHKYMHEKLNKKNNTTCISYRHIIYIIHIICRRHIIYIIHIICRNWVKNNTSCISHTAY